MTRIGLNTPITIDVDGREIKQDYLEFSRITVADAKKYLSGSFLSKKMEYMDVMMRLHTEVPDKETTQETNDREIELGVKAGKKFFRIFDDTDIINMVAALAKLPVKTIEQIDFFDLSEMAGEIMLFLLPSRTITGKKSSGK